LGVATSTIQFLRLIGSTIGTAIVASAVNAIYGNQIRAAIGPDTDPRLVEAFHNPQALIDPNVQTNLQALLAQLGAAANEQAAALSEAAHSALIAGVRFGYVMALVLALIVLILVLILRTPNYRTQPAAARPKAEPIADAL
jgi:hypothetical protein